MVTPTTKQPIPVGLATRTPFPNNVIPSGPCPTDATLPIRLSPLAQNLLKLIPTGATLADPTANNFACSGSNFLNADNFNGRSDYVLNSKTRVFCRNISQNFLRSGARFFRVSSDVSPL